MISFYDIAYNQDDVCFHLLVIYITESKLISVYCCLLYIEIQKQNKPMILMY